MPNSIRKADWINLLRPAYNAPWNIIQVGLLLAILQLPYVSTNYTSGVQWDYTDVFFLVILVSLSFSNQDRNLFFKVPFIKLWIIYGIILSVAYVYANSSEISGVHNLVYQLYRYCWKGVILYPLIVIMFRDKARIRTLVFILILSFDIMSIMAIQQGYIGSVSSGVFRSKNQFGGFAILLIPITLSIFWASHSYRDILFYGLSFLIQFRAMLFSQSRGALVGFLVSMMMFVILLKFISVLPERRKKISLLIAGCFSGVVVFIFFIVVLGKGTTLSNYVNILSPSQDKNMI